MKVFDGTSLSSIVRSLSICLNLSPKQLIKEIKLYILLKMPNLEIGDFPLQDFIEQCKTSKVFIDTPSILFDRVIFFHKTSLIDNGEFLREKGLLDIDELLLNVSPMSEYLMKKGVAFFLKEDTTYIRINEKCQRLEDMTCAKGKSSKRRIVARLTKPKLIKPEGITGFLFLSDARNDTTYERITRVPEFLLDLDDCIDGVANEWRTNSVSAILKCEVDIKSWYPEGDIHEQDNEFAKSYKIANEGFLCLAEMYAKQFKPTSRFRSIDYYPFITHGTGLPPARIKKIYQQS